MQSEMQHLCAVHNRGAKRLHATIVKHRWLLTLSEKHFSCSYLSCKYLDFREPSNKMDWITGGVEFAKQIGFQGEGRAAALL